MISKRIIPVFLLADGRLRKGTNFERLVDVGDPVSQAMIYDAQGAEEIALVDIRATLENRFVDTAVVNRIISICRLPIAVGGGIKTLADARHCFAAGADKIIVNSQAVNCFGFIRELAEEFGSQSVTISLDVRANKKGSFDVYTHSGTKKADVAFDEALERIVENGAGELVLTSIDQEGTLRGFDIELYRAATRKVKIPVIASGGAGCYDDIVRLFKETDVSACGLGKMLCLRDYDIVRIKSYLTGAKVNVREA